jgi:hypothetical protein
MPTTYDPHVVLAERSEAAARGWALLAFVVLSVTTPLVYLLPSPGIDEGFTEEPTTLWSAVHDVLFASVDDFAADGHVVPVWLARIGVALLVVGLGLATALAVQWLTTGSVADVPDWLARFTAVLVVAGVVALWVAADMLGDPGEDTGLVQGMDVAAGLLAPLVVAVTLVATRVAELWPRAGGH